MEQVVCIYCEGTDSKFAVFELDKGMIKLLRVASIDLYKTSNNTGVDVAVFDNKDGELTLDGLGSDIISQSMDDGSSGQIVEGIINAELAGIKLNKCNFVPILTEPALYYQVVNKKGTTQSFTQEIVDNSSPGTSENAKAKNKPKKKTVKVGGKKKSSAGSSSASVEIADGGSLKIQLRQDTSCIQLVNKLARYNHRRNYKITAVKSAEVSLANYVAKKKKFFPDDYSLIVYIGKEYSKLVFLYGRTIKHIGSTLDIGTTNLHTYDVYFSKILLEMENGAVPNLDNIIVCGEDVSENLVLSFYGTFPETNVSRLEFEDIDTSAIGDADLEKLSSFSVPIAVISELNQESITKQLGINLVPAWVLEDQKVFQFAWHGFLMLPLLFIISFYLTQQILINNTQSRTIEAEITVKEALKQQNLEILGQIENLDARINSFDQTQTILDSISVGSEIWGRMLNRFAALGAEKRSFWLSALSIDDKKDVKVEGYSLNQNVLTEITSRLDSALLRSIVYDPIRDKDAYRFLINLKQN